ncbi:MAG: hypothetical protein M9936_04545 [Caldilinea sp.]|nr:hypothetical protein [Caldilineaceae bacterium]MCB9117065.1 hypothetical protein [Caldilineaceae bacterium]MCB9125900.1 hypothetical protein [Caldilineaceae bacterium]MCO5208941.1 hypothetical protein [Caldilinea sp.]
MLTAVEHTVHAISAVVQTVPVGTNVALVRILWIMMSGAFLQSRGAFFTALATMFAPAEVRRSWAALRNGSWECNELLENWHVFVASENQWRVRRHEGYEAVSVDMTGFWRPRLKGWLGKHYHSLAQRSLPAVVFGVVVLSGQVRDKRTPLLQRIVRCKPEVDKASFRMQLLQETKKHTLPNQVTVYDAEFEVADLQRAAIDRYVVRLATNCTARRNQLPRYKGKGCHPKYGELVRPLPRKHKDKTIAASIPHQEGHFVHEGRRIDVQSWHDLVLPTSQVGPDAPTFDIYVFHDPLYKQPLVLGTDLTKIKAETVYHIYRDRWPVEQPPLAAKQMIGLHRQFVFADESCFRLPELSLVAGAILTYTAAVLPPIPSGFWDRTPAATPGRLRRLLARADFSTLPVTDPQLRKKNSPTAHLPKGIDAHRRLKPSTPPPITGN